MTDQVPELPILHTLEKWSIGHTEHGVPILILTSKEGPEFNVALSPDMCREMATTLLKLAGRGYLS